MGVGNKRVAVAPGKQSTEMKIERAVANTLNSFRNGVVGFIDWLDPGTRQLLSRARGMLKKRRKRSLVNLG